MKCNIRCKYCYENPQRDAGNVLNSYDLARIKAGVEREGGPFTLFGGESLLVPEKDLEDLFAWGFEKYGGSVVQTNGILIGESHIRLFRKYKVGVGISVDGPEELNDLRWAGSLQRTREATARTHTAIERLCQEGMPPGLIVTLHRKNATPELLPRMHDWFRWLDSLGVPSARLHLLEVDHVSVRRAYALTVEENLEALLSFARLEPELSALYFDVFKEARSLLLGQDDHVSCVSRACDPYTTQAVQGVDGQGQRNNCGQTNKDGVDFVKSDFVGYERYLALYATPQADGGCQGCRFFLMCKGHCPGTAIDGDWRNRTEHCEVWKGLYERFERSLTEEGLAPLSQLPVRSQLERFFLDAWTEGLNFTLRQALEQIAREQPAGA
ncbi:MAG TPA: radical SAM protein [Thermoanaerobaculia bacterium]